ncbi:MAG: hypothetical protein QM773_10390 [Hyphomonadaceae bacterium]
MRLIRALIRGSGPFERVELPFAEEDGRARLLTVVHGGGGTGKTTLVQALATTRPGHAIAQLGRSDTGGAGPALVACEWLLGADDPTRPHSLSVASPNVRLHVDEAVEALRRREQVHYDRVAQEGGFVFLAIPSTRWFSRQPIMLSAPARGVARYDVRAPLSLDDASRADLARETKQALAYAAIAVALAGVRDREERRYDLLAEAMRGAVDRLADLAGYRYLGLEPHSLEPVFAESSGQRRSFDALPTRARHLVAFAALSVRVLWAAYPEQDPRDSEGVIAIDDIELYQDNAALARVGSALREALPAAQWILTTSSPVLAASAAASEVLALRRLSQGDAVAVFAGDDAVIH